MTKGAVLIPRKTFNENQGGDVMIIL